MKNPALWEQPGRELVREYARPDQLASRAAQKAEGSISMKRSLRFDFLGGNRGLRCPICNQENLHHFQVDTYWREEDSKTGVHVMSSEGFFQSDGNMAGNPSSRRDGINISFTCEGGCHEVTNLTLVIYQHKGTTYLEWV